MLGCARSIDLPYAEGSPTPTSSPTPGPTPGPAAYARDLTVAGPRIPGDLVDFPVLVSLTAPELRTVANGGHVSDGSDLAFTAGDGSELYAAEIEVYDALAGSLVAWVRLPSLTPGVDRVFRLQYGTPASMFGTPLSVWDDDFVGVWHLGDDVGMQVLDSTHNDLHGAPTGTAKTTGRIGNARSFDGIDDRIDLDAAGAFSDVSTGVTVTAWIRLGDIPTDIDPSASVFQKWGGNIGGFGWFFDAANVNAGIHTSNGAIQDTALAPASLAQDTWYFVGGTWRSLGTKAVFLDGVEAASAGATNTAIAPTPAMARIGACSSNGSACNFEGVIDEVRVSSIARSPEWILAEYRTVADPTFMSIGPEVALP